MNSFKCIISSEFEDKSIREMLLSLGVGKEKIYLFEKEKCFYLDQINVNQNTILKKNQKLNILINEKIDISPLQEGLNIVYEDDYYLVVNKPRGILIHDDGCNGITLANLVATYYKKHHIRRKIRFCNRLDYDTSGLVIVAKDSISEAAMNKLISQRLVEKKYYAICMNRFTKSNGEITYRIGRDRHNSQKMRVSSTGKNTLTKYWVLKNGKISWLDIELCTGRTHQIRLHLSHINHPIIGDRLYGENNDGLLCLQAYLLKFIHPFTKEMVLIKIDLDKYLKERL